MKLLLGILVFFGFALPAFADPFDFLVGSKWTWKKPTAPGECEKAEWWDVNSDQSRATIHSAEPVESRVGTATSFEYQVLSHNKNSITMFLEGEVWRDDGGDLVTWTLRFVDKDHYVWIRSGWPDGMTTQRIYRCSVTG